MRAWIRRARLFVNDRGASAVEYGLMVSAIAAVIVGVVFGLGHVVEGSFTKTYNCVYQQGNGDPFPNCPDGPTP